ncbi:MAG: hypothetical protein ACK55Z_03920 [bacterium]
MVELFWLRDKTTVKHFFEYRYRDPWYCTYHNYSTYMLRKRENIVPYPLYLHPPPR